MTDRSLEETENMRLQTTKIESNVIRIIIVDDHPIVREGLRVLLSRETGVEVCGDAGTAAEALTLIGSESPHQAIVDVLLEDGNGRDLIRSIRVLDQSVRILACSMYDERLYAERAIAAGAMGYVNSRASISTIIEAIRAVMAGEVYLSDRMKQHIIDRCAASGPIRQETPGKTLSNRELEIFRLIGHGMTTSEIGGLLNLCPRTMETHRQNIRGHLQLDSTHNLSREAAQWVQANG